jgi:hypothetical protein
MSLDMMGNSSAAIVWYVRLHDSPQSITNADMSL